MAHDLGFTNAHCEKCAASREHEVLDCEGHAAPQSRPEEPEYVFRARIRCRVCGSEKTLHKTGDWETVVEYLLEKRLIHWLPRLHLPRHSSMRRSEGGTMMSEEFLNLAPALMRNIDLEAHMLIESGSQVEAASCIAFLLSVACEEMGVKGHGFSEKVERLVVTELQTTPPDRRDVITRLEAFGNMRVHQLMGFTRQELQEAIQTIESILFKHWGRGSQRD